MFQKAQKSVARLRIALAGTAGSGKTFSALKLASGFGGTIAVIDTERHSASLYADRFNFDVCNIDPPYTPEKYIAAIQAAEKAGYATLIIDSFSHAWAGEGGLLDIHDKISSASRSGNSFTAWRNVTPMHNRLVDTILGCKCHVIATMRAKADYVQEEVNGKKTVKKVGLAPVQREGVDYEFTLVFDVSQDHVASSSKDRTSLFDGRPCVITEETGKQLVSWLNAKEEPVKPRPEAQPQKQPANNDGKKAYTIGEIMGIISSDLTMLMRKYKLGQATVINLFNEFQGDEAQIAKAIEEKHGQKAAQEEK